jgi:hypothetical protein
MQEGLGRRNNFGDRIDGPWIFRMVEKGTNIVKFFFVLKKEIQKLVYNYFAMFIYEPL